MNGTADSTADSMAENASQGTDDRRDGTRRRRIGPALAGWAILATLFLLWQTLTYRGLMALAAEWQFNTFGRYYPSLTYVLLATIIASPVLWLLRGRHHDDNGAANGSTAANAAPLPGRTFIRTVLGIAAACAVICVVVSIAMILLPGDTGAVRRIAVGSPAAADPPTGPTALSGAVLRNRTAGLSQDLLVARRTIRFAPMVPPAGGDAQSIRYFVEIGADENAATLQGNGLREGVLRRGGLPGELEYLFRYAGYDIASPYYVLFASRGALQWPYRVAAIQLALAGIICLIAAGGLHLRRERLRRRLHQHDERHGVTPP